MTAVTASAPRGSARTGLGPARDDPGAAGLVARARGGDKQAWDALVERYAPLIWSICRQYRLGRADAEDVGQSVWLHLVDRMGQIREPAALPGWLATTTRRECARLVRAARGPYTAWCPLDAETIADETAGAAEQDLLAAERHAALRQAFAGLSPDGQQLIAMLTAPGRGQLTFVPATSAVSDRRRPMCPTSPLAPRPPPTAPAVPRPAPSPATPGKYGPCCATASSSSTTPASSCPAAGRSPRAERSHPMAGLRA